MLDFWLCQELCAVFSRSITLGDVYGRSGVRLNYDFHPEYTYSQVSIQHLENTEQNIADEGPITRCGRLFVYYQTASTQQRG